MLKTIGLFLLTNIAVIAVASIAMSVFGVGSILQANGVDLNYDNLFMFAMIFGFAGSFVSLALSKFMAKQLTGAQVITEPRNADETWLVETVYALADKAGIGRPEVAIYDSPDPNAFATGMNKNNAMVAVSTGLLRNMTKNEIAAVLGHEVAHIANGDMVTMALLQGVVNTFVIFFARIAGHFVDRIILKNEEGYGIGYYVASFIFEILFGILASIIVMWFSRHREFRADKGGAYLAGKENMIAALRRLGSMEPGELPDQLAAFGISDKPSRLGELFASHPPIEERIAKLEATPESELKVA
ncbi:protease HtpX [Galenea microaerophila]